MKTYLAEDGGKGEKNEREEFNRERIEEEDRGREIDKEKIEERK